ncbi:hypothetical protein C8F01DRAFT_1084387 [Mycena amicta]|nr:hypothetical protein C8F01DRAFT_1084387 [Mycena amicta]
MTYLEVRREPVARFSRSLLFIVLEILLQRVIVRREPVARFSRSLLFIVLEILLQRVITLRPYAPASLHYACISQELNANPLAGRVFESRIQPHKQATAKAASKLSSATNGTVYSSANTESSTGKTGQKKKKALAASMDMEGKS